MSGDIKTMELMQLVKDAVKIRIMKEEADAALSVINDELRDRLVKMKITGMKVDGHFLSTVKRISVTDVAFSKAKELGATKVVADGEKLRKLYQAGIKIRGVRVNTFIQIREVK